MTYQDSMMQTNRRCYCNRLYPGFRCGYCRVADFVADEVRPDPREESWQRRMGSGKGSIVARRIQKYGAEVR